ncbi:MAG: 2-hydroxyacid dehydrogenase [Burkholderiales bacterium]
MKVLILHDVFFFGEAVAAMREVATVTMMRNASREALLAEVAEAEAIVVGPGTFVDRHVIDSAARLKLIARIGVGVDRIDLQAATDRGVFVTNNRASTADTVSEFTVALLLGLAKNLPSSDRAVREGQWVAGKERATYDSIELYGKTHGVVGMGEIGSRVAAVCKTLGMKVLYFRRNRNADLERLIGVEYAPFDKLIRESDTISIHTPLTDETRNLFDKPQFEAMKSTALLINQSRGQVVNEKALLQALKEEKIGGYATDVYEQEPPDPNSELFKLKNVIVAPHVGGLSREAGLRYSMTIAEAVLAVAKGEVPDNLVNRGVLEKIVHTKD